MTHGQHGFLSEIYSLTKGFPIWNHGQNEKKHAKPIHLTEKIDKHLAFFGFFEAKPARTQLEILQRFLNWAWICADLNPRNEEKLPCFASIPAYL